MYNRYIPRPDGSYQKTRLPDQNEQHQPPRLAHQPRQQTEKINPPTEEKKEVPQPGQKPEPDRHGSKRCKPTQEKKFSGKQHIPDNASSMSAGSFLKQLLPKDCDTGDLLIIILLLLMAGDNPDEKNSALLTLAIYLFM